MFGSYSWYERVKKLKIKCRKEKVRNEIFGLRKILKKMK